MLRELGGREPEPTAVILESRTLRSTPAPGKSRSPCRLRRPQAKPRQQAALSDRYARASAGVDRYTANQNDRKKVDELARQVQEATDKHVELGYVDQDYTGQDAAEAAENHGIRLEVVKLPYAKRRFVLPPRR